MDSCQLALRPHLQMHAVVLEFLVRSAFHGVNFMKISILLFFASHWGDYNFFYVLGTFAELAFCYLMMG